MREASNTLINYYEFETEYIKKSVQLYSGNILEFNRECDILIISCVNNRFKPVNNSLIQWLFEIGIDVNELSKNPEIDLRPQFNAWISKEINCPKLNFKRIACISFELHASDVEIIDKSLKSIFSILSLAQSVDGINMRSIAMPIIGTGSNKIRVENIVENLFNVIKKSLNDLKPVKDVYIIDRNERKLFILDAMINRNLQRSNSELNYIFLDQDCVNICEDMKVHAQKIISNKNKIREVCALDELIFNINNHDLRFFQIAFLGRKTLELLLSEKIKNRKTDDELKLFTMIQLYQKENRVSSWIVNYMHIIRIIGNKEVHNDIDKKYIPEEININDQKIFMKCLSRVLEYFIEIDELL